MGYFHIGHRFAIKSILTIVGIAVVLLLVPYPIITSDKLLIAVFGGFFLGAGIGLVNFTIITISNGIHWSLISLGTNYADTTASEAPHFATLAIMHYEAYYWAHFLLLMCYAVGGSVLYYSLFKIKLIPLWLAVWGLLASSIVFAGGALQLADIPVSFYLFLQNGVFVLTFIGYLLAMGFRTENTMLLIDFTNKKANVQIIDFSSIIFRLLSLVFFNEILKSTLRLPCPFRSGGRSG